MRRYAILLAITTAAILILTGCGQPARPPSTGSTSGPTEEASSGPIMPPLPAAEEGGSPAGEGPPSASGEEVRPAAPESGEPAAGPPAVADGGEDAHSRLVAETLGRKPDSVLLAVADYARYSTLKGVSIDRGDLNELYYGTPEPVFWAIAYPDDQAGSRLSVYSLLGGRAVLESDSPCTLLTPGEEFAVTGRIAGETRQRIMRHWYDRKHVMVIVRSVSGEAVETQAMCVDGEDTGVIFGQRFDLTGSPIGERVRLGLPR